MTFLIEVMQNLAAHGTLDQCAEIVAYGDKRLQTETDLENFELISGLVAKANRRIKALQP